MPCNAQFGIIDDFDKDKDYGEEYKPQKYNCVSIDDDILNDWWERLLTMKSYFHCCSRPETALARWGVTLIPPESFDLFYAIVEKDTKPEDIYQVQCLLKLIKQAKIENKFILHYGV